MHEHVDESRHRPWIGAMIIVGALYCFVGIAFAAPARQVHAWRLAAWGVSAAAWASHVAYERFKLRSSARSGAAHVAAAVALGAFGLAAAANIRSLSVASPHPHGRLLLPALVIWPVVTALPAFLASLAGSWALARLPRATESNSRERSDR